MSIDTLSEPEIQEIRPPRPSILRSSLRFGLVSLVAYAFSFAKSLVTARYFGTSAEMDSFTLAFLVPNLLASLLSGTFALSVVPALAAAEVKSTEERSNTFRAGLFLFVAIASVLAVSPGGFLHPDHGLGCATLQ